MNENSKTIIFLVAAAALVATAWFGRPSLPVADPGDVRGQRLFPDFTAPLAAVSMEIVEFDEDTATVRPFSVAQVEVKGKKRWSIPSHDNYPADAEDQLAEAAAGLMGLEILGVASDDPGDHELYGVVDPDPKGLEAGASGVGMRVTMKDTTGKQLMSLIIGKQVPDRSELCYVRRVGQDAVYTTALKTDKLSSKFEDWIEKDLLKLSAWDIRQIWIRDHSVDELQGALIQRGEMTLKYDDTGDPKWKMVKDVKFAEDKWVPVEMADDEELDTDKLGDMKSALDDLKIVDVRPKPAGLSGDLKAEEDFNNNREAVASLARRGFYVAKLGDQVELFSNQGEVRCLMKDGVEYVLRFGEVATGSTASNSEDEDSKSSGLNRYIFVMAEFNPEPIDKPELEPLPEPQEKTDDAGAAPEDDAQKAEGDSEEQSDEKADEKADEGTDEKADEASDDKAGEEADDKADTDAERERIEKENKRKQEEYDEKIEEGKKKVTDLNARFADWYYIISDEVYKKIHLSRKDIVKKKEKEEKEGDDKEGDQQEGKSGEGEAEKAQGTETQGGEAEGGEAAAGEDQAAEEQDPADEQEPAEEKPPEQSGDPEKQAPEGDQ